METLLELRAGGHQAAAQAVEMFCYQARKTIGSLAAVLGGLDLLVFAGGIGENAAIDPGPRSAGGWSIWASNSTRRRTAPTPIPSAPRAPPAPSGSYLPTKT